MPKPEGLEEVLLRPTFQKRYRSGFEHQAENKKGSVLYGHRKLQNAAL